MDVKNLTDQQLAELLGAVNWGEVEKGEAAQVLRAAVSQYHKSEVALENLKTAIDRVEAALVYGSFGRPVREFTQSRGFLAGFNPFGDEPAIAKSVQPAPAEQSQEGAVPPPNIERCARRCDMAGTEIDCTSIDSRHALQICNAGCLSLSQCTRALGT